MKSGVLAIAALLLLGSSARASLSESTICATSAIGTDSCESSTANGSTTAASIAGYGVLKAATLATSSNDIGVHSSAVAIFADQLTITSPDHPDGSIGTITIGLKSDFVVTFQGGRTEGSAAFTFNAQSAVSSTLSQRSAYYSNNETTQTFVKVLQGFNDNQLVGFDSPFTATWSFIYGVPFSVNGQLGVDATALGAEAFMSVDAAHSAYWGGIQSVKVDGVTDGDFTIQSVSGTDWHASMIPVDEPPVVVMLLAGLAGVLTRCRRREA